jgi:hypothetical protein
MNIKQLILNTEEFDLKFYFTMLFISMNVLFFGFLSFTNFFNNTEFFYFVSFLLYIATPVSFFTIFYKRRTINKIIFNEKEAFILLGIKKDSTKSINLINSSLCFKYYGVSQFMVFFNIDVSSDSIKESCHYKLTLKEQKYYTEMISFFSKHNIDYLTTLKESSKTFKLISTSLLKSIQLKYKLTETLAKF